MNDITNQIRRGWMLGPGRMFYGWWIVFVATFLAAIASGAYFAGFSAFFLALIEEFDVSRGALSSVVSIAQLQTALTAPFQGYVTDRFGPRRVMYVGIAMMGLGFILISTAQSFILFAVYLVVFISMGATMGFIFPALTAIANWFIKRRGIAFGIAICGFWLGSALVVGTNYLVESLAWRGAAVTLGFIVWGVGFPLASLVRYRPEQYGMLPDGEKRPDEASGPDVVATPLETDFTVREALRASAFWWMSLSFCCRSFVHVALAVHFIPAMQEKGFSSGTAAALFGLLGFLTIASLLGSGLLADAISKRLVGIYQAALMIVAMLVFVWAASLWQIVMFLTLYALTTGAGSLRYAMLGEHFGRKHFATINGFGLTIVVIGGALGPAFAGFSFDATDSYDVAFYGFALAALVAAIAMLMTKRTSGRVDAGHEVPKRAD